MNWVSEGMFTLCLSNLFKNKKTDDKAFKLRLVDSRPIVF